VHVISRRALRDFGDLHPDAVPALDHWYRVTKKAQWTNLAQLRQDFPHADAVGDLTLFNIGGNKYRLVARVDYRARLVLVRAVLTHRDYDRGGWKK